MSNDVAITVTSRDLSGPGMRSAAANVNQGTKAAKDFADKLARAQLSAKTMGLTAQSAGRQASAANELAAKAARDLAEAQTEAAVANRLAARAAQELENGEIDAAVAAEASKRAEDADKRAAELNTLAQRAQADAYERTERAALRSSAAQLAAAKAARVASEGPKGGGEESIVDKIGELFGTRAGGMFGEATPYLLAAIAAAAPTAGAILGAGLVTGIGAAGIGTAIVAQASNPMVKRAWTSLGKDAKTELQEATAGFAPELVKSADVFGDALKSHRGDLEGFFQPLEAEVVPLSRALAGMLDPLLDDLPTLAQEFKPVFGVVENELPRLGHAVSDLVQDMTSDPETLARAFTIAFRLVDAGIETVGVGFKLLDAQAKTTYMIFGWLIKGAEAYGSALGKVNPLAKAAGSAIGWLGDKLGITSDTSHKAADASDKMGDSQAQAAEKTRELSGALDRLNTAIDKYLGNALSVFDATTQFANAQADLGKSLRANGTSFDLNTAAGRANRQALSDAVSAAKSLYDANVQNGEAADKASGALNRQVGALVAQMHAAGMSNGEINKLLRSMGLIRDKTGHIYVKGTATAKKQVDSLRGSINSLHGKTVTITTKYLTSGHPTGGNRATGGIGDINKRGLAKASGGLVGAVPMAAFRGISAAATGGARNGMTLVGEYGPELAELPAGTRVNSAPDTQRMLGAGGGPIQLELVLTGGDPLTRAMIQQVRMFVRTNGGDVQAALGGRKA